MFDNIGSKIKNLTKICCWIMIVIGVAGGLVLLIMGADWGDGLMIGLGLAAMIVLPLLAWIGSFLMYGFGELVENSQIIAGNTRGNTAKSITQKTVENARITKFEKLRAQGLITEEEYQEAIKKEGN
ncbi:MAG: hypothetical protein IJW87_03720 [Clostridia bacterium]|nr:hypothetical protein [Clostridia bacterium]